MQFSLPALPFDPALAKASGKATPSSRVGDANSRANGTEFGDLLPADPQRGLNLKPASGKALGLGVSKRSIQSSGESDENPLEQAGDDSESADTDVSSESWTMGSAVPPRFVASLPPTLDETATAGEAAASESPIPESPTTDASSAESSEGAEAVSTESTGFPQAQPSVVGGKAVGLTRAMPAKAQGEGRAHAILHRAERSAAVLIRSARETAASDELSGETSDEPVESAPEPTATNEQDSSRLDSGAAIPVAFSTLPESTPSAPQASESTESTAVVTQSSALAERPAVPLTQESTAATKATDSPTWSEPSSGTALPQGFAVATVSDSQVQPDEAAIPSPLDPSVINSENQTSALPAETLTVPTPNISSTDAEEEASAPIATDLSQAISNDVSKSTSSSRGSGVVSGKTFPRTGADKSGPSIGLDIAAEKFAGGFDRARPIASGHESRSEIKSVSSDIEQLTTKLNRLGINVAEPGFSMAAPATFSNSSSTLSGVETSSAVSAAMGSSNAQGDDVLRSASSSAAQRAVESAVAIAEHFSNGERRSVNLQFTVSGVDLAVRVELRGADVHTTFRTDSPELRAALAHEWQVVNAQPADRPMRLADPVFASSSNGSSAQPDAGSHQQRETGARGGQFENNSFAGFRSPPRSSTAAAPRPINLVQEADLALGRLRTFA